MRLNSLNDKLRSEVELIVEDDVLDFAEKFTILSDLIVDSNVLRQILHSLNTNEKKEEKEPNEDDFLNLVGEKKQKLMRLLITREDFNMLEKLISCESEKAQTAYEKWKLWKITQMGPDVLLSSDDNPSIRESVELDEEEEAGIFTDPDFFNKFPDCVNILILGENGVGKATFINALVNYLKYGTFDKAQKNKIEILIKTYFTRMTIYWTKTKIECEPTIAIERGEEFVTDESGHSFAPSPNSYVFTWGPKGSQKMIRIIDMPSFGDCRGLEKENENFSNLLNLISNLKEIHATCILLNPNDSKLSLAFRYGISEFLTRFHKSVIKNIMFCFTKTYQTHYRPGSTLPALEAYLKDLKERRGIDIPLSSKTMFCFDNEAFLFLCAQRKGAPIANHIHGNKKLWKMTTDETFRMFQRIADLPAHNVSETLSVNNVRSVILTLASPLADLAGNLMFLNRLIEDVRRENREGQAFIEEQLKLRKQLHKDHDSFSKSCADFVSFLHTNCILPYNHVYMENLECLIKYEKEWVSQGGSGHLLQQLERRRDENGQQVEFLKSYGTSANDAKSIEEIYDMVDDLKRMEDSGSYFEEIQNLELLKVRDEQISKVTPVDLSTGWQGRNSRRKKNNGGGRGKKNK